MLPIARLPEPLRTVVVLHYFDDLPLSEIGKVLSAPLGTVKFRLHRARLELLKDLSQTISCETSSNIM